MWLALVVALVFGLFGSLLQSPLLSVRNKIYVATFLVVLVGGAFFRFLFLYSRYRRERLNSKKLRQEMDAIVAKHNKDDKREIHCKD